MRPRNLSTNALFLFEQIIFYAARDYLMGHRYISDIKKRKRSRFAQFSVTFLEFTIKYSNFLDQQAPSPLIYS